MTKRNQTETKPMLRMLIVEDDASTRKALSHLLGDRFIVEACELAEEAETLLGEFRPDIILTDVRLPGESGLALLDKARVVAPEAIVIVMTGHSSIETAVQAMRSGARDFIVKPINFEALDLVISRELEHQQIALDVKRLREQALDRINDEGIWGESEEMQSILKTAVDVADSHATVLLTGESGTGKDIVARFLHRHSSRRDHPFVAVNCGAIPENLLESEFFGHEKGAFTGAHAQKLGRFEQANHGTLFLDEIGDLPINLQVKLLRALQERQIDRVGGTGPINIDVRVIAATNQDLEKRRDAGAFREDLFYRLNVIQLKMPPLRERKADIPSLWSRFIDRFATRENLPIPKAGAGVLNALYSYDWPGNVRELENVAERAVIMSRGAEIQLAHLPASVRESVPCAPGIRIPGSTLDDIEKEAILRTLAAVNGSTSRAASMLGVSVRKIQYRLQRWRDEAHLDSDELPQEPRRSDHPLGTATKTATA
jgi:DNA-binding NtrC family response regulator